MDGKRPVVVNKPLIGFIANRIQSALMREAVSLIDRGIASAEDVDTAVRFGFGFRYAAAGPIIQKEHSGWEISYGLWRTVLASPRSSTGFISGLRMPISGIALAQR